MQKAVPSNIVVQIFGRHPFASAVDEPFQPRVKCIDALYVQITVLPFASLDLHKGDVLFASNTLIRTTAIGYDNFGAGKSAA